MINEKGTLEDLREILHEELAPHVQAVDQEAHYVKPLFKRLGAAGFFQKQASEQATILTRLTVIEETAKTCMTSAFCLWCHFAATTYITHSENGALQEKVLPKLLSGTLIAGTGLSNPLKSFAKLETIHLQAEKEPGGYRINGTLPAVSNIGAKHAFAFIAEVASGGSVMGFVEGDAAGLELTERTDFVGINGSATYACTFTNVLIRDEAIISTEARAYVEQIRTRFVAYQIPLAFGVTEAALTALKRLKDIRTEISSPINAQREALSHKNNELRKDLRTMVDQDSLTWEALLDIRLQSVYVTLEAVQTAMIYEGGRGYVKGSDASRNLREAYFLVNLTPTVIHLESIKQEASVVS